MTSNDRDFRVAHRWGLGPHIGAGGFGVVYVGIDIFTNEEVALKFERIETTEDSQIFNESTIISCLNISPNGQPVVGIPKIHWYGSERDYNAMAIDLLGRSLEDLFNFCDRRFSLKTVLMLADQMLQRVEYVHSRFFIHRDIKPGNILMGPEKDANTVYIIDFGLSKEYRDPETLEHIPYRKDKTLSGTVSYASIRNHHGIEDSRRDDLESLGFVFMYFIRGSLPWQGLRGANKAEKDQNVLDCKITTSIDELCKNYPQEFVTYFRYCRSLGFDECPDYDYLRELFTVLYFREGFPNDGIFDWTITNNNEMANPSDNPNQLSPTLQAGPSGRVPQNQVLAPIQETLNQQRMVAHATENVAEREGGVEAARSGAGMGAVGGAPHRNELHAGIASASNAVELLSISATGEDAGQEGAIAG